ncbi:MAG: hypothetical protein FWG89_11140 [Treponema sp.]|nr:hypothetical protein [Treponema sp.]
MRWIYKLLVILMFFLPVFIQAGGGRQITTQTAEGEDIWRTEFDVSRLRPGTYNIIVNAHDAAGNVGVSGPFNIRVDPTANLPEVMIVYPEPNQVIRSDIDIVGVATARYGVKQLFIKINNGPWEQLDGREYWDYFIPAEDLNEGYHTVSVKATDLNDLEGPEFSLGFYLDDQPPAIELLSHEIGDYISGTARIRGKVTDHNGIASLSMSTDGGLTFSNLSTSSGGKNDPARYFQFRFPSKRYPDGPVVYFLRAVNRLGFSETRPILFYVNNRAPEIHILSPSPTEDSFWRTQVTGRVISGVGLSEFYFEWPGEVDEELAGTTTEIRGNRTLHHIPLRPGDPFWTVEVFFSLANNRPVPFRVTAVDKSGNTTIVTEHFRDTRRNRSPTLIIEHPTPPTGMGRMELDYDQPIYGRILPGFFPSHIIIEPDVIEYAQAQPSFRIDPEMFSEGMVGAFTMRFWAAEEEEQTGQAVDLRVNRQAPPPGVRIVESPIIFDYPRHWDDYGDYRTPWVRDMITYEGFVEDYQPGHRVEYRLRWDDPWKVVNVDSEGEFTQTINISNFPDGPVQIEFRTTRGGNRPDVPLYVPVNKYSTLPVIEFLTPAQRFGVVQRSTTAAGVIDYTVPLERVSYSTNGVDFTNLNFTRKYGRAWFNYYADFTAIHNAGEELIIRAVDRAGNIVDATPNFIFDNSDAFPKIIHNAPREGDVITGDFTISGLAYLDVGISGVFYRVLTPDNPWDTVARTYTNKNPVVDYISLDTTQHYSIPVSIWDVNDGENILEIYAEDYYGNQGDILTIIFKVSTAAPRTTVIEPAMDGWVKKNVRVRGTAYDLNGISEILVSMDNGVSYQRADFTSDPRGSTVWSYNLNSEIYTDGTYTMLIRSTDRYGITSFSSGIINIDNTPPVLDVGSPINGDNIGYTLFVAGQLYDSIGIKNVSVQIVNIHNPGIQFSYDLTDDLVFREEIYTEAFPDGIYTVKITAVDYADNETAIVRNISIIKARAASEIAIMNPMPGIEHTGQVIVSGRISGAVIPENVTLMMNRNIFAEVNVDRYGIFSYELSEDMIWPDNPAAFSASFVSPDGDRINSFDNHVRVNNFGPVVMVDSHRDGNVVTKRPWITGRAFYIRPENEENLTRNQARELFGVKNVEISLDNGVTFSSARGTNSWRYRLETGELQGGTLPIIVKATFHDESIAVRRLLLVVDTRSPVVTTIGPVENDAFRSSVLVYGSTLDEYDMDRVEITLRPGDKFGYSVPSFIQGLYFDSSIFGATLWSASFGLTFFDDNVKLQAVFGEAPRTDGRVTGHTVGGKVLANVYNQNLSHWFGPDWEFWNTSLVLGAQFMYFYEMLPNPVWVGQFLGQWEMIKADMGYFYPNWKYFKTFSMYLEPGIWFLPSAAHWAPMMEFRIGIGWRISLF